MPPNNGREDNVEYVEVESPAFDADYYHGGVVPEVYPAYEVDPASPEAFQEAVETPRTAARVVDLPTQDSPPPDPEDAYQSLTRDEMLKALEAEDIEHDLRKNASRAKVIAVYSAHFLPPTE